MRLLLLLSLTILMSGCGSKSDDKTEENFKQKVVRVSKRACKDHGGVVHIQFDTLWDAKVYCASNYKIFHLDKGDYFEGEIL